MTDTMTDTLTDTLAKLPRLLLALAACTVLAACSSSPSKPQAGGSPTASGSSPTSSPTPSASPTPGATTQPSGPPACATRALRASVGTSQGTAGSTYTNLDLTNVSGTTCSLYGYPGVALAGGTPVTQIGAPATRDTSSPRVLVPLAPGAVGHALLRITDASNLPPDQCGPVTAQYLQIYPPGQTTPIYLAYTAKACSKQVSILSVAPFAAGTA